MSCKWNQCLDITAPVPRRPVATNDDALADALAPRPPADPLAPCLRFLRLWGASWWCQLLRRLGRRS